MLEADHNHQLTTVVSDLHPTKSAKNHLDHRHGPTNHREEHWMTDSSWLPPMELTLA
jgi:hypothetical protein